ncbi:MAG: M1 family metallopeptidase [Bacteroidota bacterium]
MLRQSLLLFLLCASAFTARADYWQQEVNYEMQIDFDVENHQFTGRQQLAYVNHSPDTLSRVYYHLYFNAFQPNSMMDVRSRTIVDPDRRVKSRILALSENEIGYHKINSLSHNGRPVQYSVEGTILVVDLDEPILPGESAYFDMFFNSQVPLQIRRSGRDNAEGIDYSMSQWYPKMAEYDHEGWHSNPYVGREFHGVWGDFDVEISIDPTYMLAATGYLQNPEQIGKGYGNPAIENTPPMAEGEKLTWHFKAEMVHDFVWAADPDYVHDRLEVEGGPELHFFYQKDVATTWDQLKPFAAKCFQIVNANFGKYPYTKYSIIQGGDGGMEYPMATLVTGKRGLNSLIGVVVHEAIHSWFQGALATNESLYPWMDEGFTSYAESFVINRLRTSPSYNPHAGSYIGYLNLVESGFEEPSSTHADHYNRNRAYGTASYSKGAICLHQLGYVIGEETLMRGMRRYFETWKFKHPTPTDFKRVMEKESGMQLDWYFEYWINSTKTIDYGFELEGQSLTLKREGLMPMPIDVVVTYKDGSQVYYYIPMVIMRGEKNENWYGSAERTLLEDWPWVNPTYNIQLAQGADQVATIEIDPSYRMADVNRRNNYYPKPKKDKKAEYGAYGANLPGSLD